MANTCLVDEVSYWAKLVLELLKRVNDHLKEFKRDINRFKNICLDVFPLLHRVETEEGSNLWTRSGRKSPCSLYNCQCPMQGWIILVAFVNSSIEMFHIFMDRSLCRRKAFWNFTLNEPLNPQTTLQLPTHLHAFLLVVRNSALEPMFPGLQGVCFVPACGMLTRLNKARDPSIEGEGGFWLLEMEKRDYGLRMWNFSCREMQLQICEPSLKPHG